MPNLLLVGQETGGIGKTTVTRGLAEAVTEAALLEIESTHRLLEFPEVTTANEPGTVRYFEMRAKREKVEETGGRAAREELDLLINALYEINIPTILDLGANLSATVFGIMPGIIGDLREAGIDVGVVIVAAADAGALADASKLLHLAKGWASARFVIANEVRGTIDAALLKKAVGGASISTLRQFIFDDATREVLESRTLRGIPTLDKAKLVEDHKPALANRIARDLTAFRLAVMMAVKPAAEFLIGPDGDG